jgi:hypothetical protein
MKNEIKLPSMRVAKSCDFCYENEEDAPDEVGKKSKNKKKLFKIKKRSMFDFLD